MSADYLPPMGADPLRQMMPLTGDIGRLTIMMTNASASRITESAISTPHAHAGDVQIREARQSAPARLRAQPTNTNPKAKASSLTALHALVRTRNDFTKFNKVVDSLKAQEGWESALSEMTGRLRPEHQAKLMRMTPLELRGFDRQAMTIILKEVKALAEAGRINASSADLELLEETIASLETLVLTVSDDDMTYLGGGAVNSVYMVKYTDSEGDVTEAVFKPDPADLDGMTKFKEAHFGTAAASGIPPGTEGHLPSRAVASSKVDHMLYGNRHISVNTQFVIVNGRRGILMQKAKGKSPKPTGDLIQETIDLNEDAGVRRALLPDLRQGRAPSKATLRMIAVSKGYEQVTYQNGVMKGQRKEVRQLDPVRPNTAAGLIRLQIKDVINGECDRHPENYFIDDEGNVTGIDEDCCFGVRALPEGDVRGQPPIPIVGSLIEIPNQASLMLRLPPVVTEEMKQEVAALYENQGNLARMLFDHISKEEVSATLHRLKTLHDHINSDQCMVVERDEDLLSSDAMAQYDTNNSLLMRELYVHRPDGEKGWNFLRAHRDK